MSLELTILVIIILVFGIVVFRGSPYVPSHKHHIRQAFSELYQLGNEDFVVDIGSGDGVVLREAAKTGASAIGFEINPILVFISKILSKKFKKVEIKFADFWLVNLPPATTVIYVFSVTRDVKRIAMHVQRQSNLLNKPLYIISYGSKFEALKEVKNVGPYYLYLVEPLQPAKAQV